MDYSQKTGIGFQFILNLMSPSSPFGQSKLKELDMYPHSEKEKLLTELDNVEKAVFFLKADSCFFDTVTHILSQTKDIRKSISRIENGAVADEVELFEIKRFSELSSLLKTELEKKLCDFDGIELSDLANVGQLLSAENAGGFTVSSRFSEKLKEIRELKASVNKKFAAECNPQKKLVLKEEHAALALREQNEEFEVRKRLSSRIAPYSAAMLNNSAAMGVLDLLIEKGKLSLSLGGVRPKIGENLCFRALINPMISDSLQADDRLFSPVTVSADKGVTVITGANMGGKTVALKTIALGAYLALCGFFVFAQCAEVPLFDFIEIVSDNLRQDARGLSSFGGEIIKLNEIYQNTEKNKALVLFDEFGAGTNADEGAKFFRAAVKAFDRRNSIVFMSTHFDNVADSASAHYQVAGLKNVSCKDIEKALKADKHKNTEVISKFMDYGLIKTDTSTEVPKDAVLVARLLGLDKDILDNLD